MKILLSGLVTSTYVKYLQKHLWDGDRITCLITNPSPLFNVKVPFVGGPKTRKPVLRYELPENYKTAGANKDIFLYFISSCSELQMANHLEGLKLYFKNSPQNLKQNMNIIYETVPSIYSAVGLSSDAPALLEIEKLMQESGVSGRLIHYPTYSPYDSFFASKKFMFKRFESRPFASNKDSKRGSSSKDLACELTTFGFLDKIVGDQESMNKVICGLPEVVYYDHDRSATKFTY